MPVVSTDDQARRLRYIYLGPVGFRLPFDARFPAMGLWAGLTATFLLLSYAFNPPGTRLWLLGSVIGAAVALLITRRVMRHVDHDRPLRWWAGAVVAAEFATPRPIDNTPIPFEVVTPTDLYVRERADA